MKIDWIPDGEEAEYDPTNDINEMIESIDKTLEDSDGKLEEVTGAADEFKKLAEELGEWTAWSIHSIQI